MPGAFQSNAGLGVPNVPRSMPAVRGFISGESPYFEYPYALAGTTKDSAGAALAAVTLVVFRTADNSVAALGVSDASGNYRLGASPAITHYISAYLAGSPDVAGTTVNTLVGS